MKLRIATRRSPLALWQANEVARGLTTAHPGLQTELVATDTAPDLDLGRSIADIGGKGAFSKEIQALVLTGAADLAVHSAKDLQAVTPVRSDDRRVPPAGHGRGLSGRGPAS